MGLSQAAERAIEQVTKGITQEELDEALPFIEHYMLNAKTSVDSGVLLDAWRKADLSGLAEKPWHNRWTGVLNHAITAGYLMRIGFNRSESDRSHQNVQTKYVHPSKYDQVISADNITANIERIAAESSSPLEAAWSAYQLGCERTRQIMKG
jgi:hypothetical protein